MNDSPTLIAGLRKIIQEAPPGDLASLYPQLSALAAECLPRLLQVTQETKSTGVSEGDVMWTVQDVADFLKVPVDWVYIHQKELGAEKWGRKLRFSRKAIMAKERYRRLGS